MKVFVNQETEESQNGNGHEAAISETIDSLSPEQWALLMLRLKKKLSERAGEKSDGAQIPRAPRNGELPLSFAQQRLWFLDQLEPNRDIYNIPAAVRLTGHLDVPALGRALTEIVRRHESLRTTFISIDGRPAQLIHEPAPLEIPLTDLSDLQTEQREAEARRMADEQACRPFDLSRGPLLRLSLLRLSEREHVLVLVLHHIISDGWSSGVIIRELAALYRAFSAGMESPLAELEVQYADYAVWQRERLQGEELERQLDYWRAQLEGAPAVLELPTDRPRPAVQSHRGAREAIELDEGLVKRLREVGSGEGATLFMVLLAAFQLLLSRYSGQQDVLTGSTIAGRNQLQTEGLVGFFVNTLVIRSKVNAEETYRQFLSQVKETCLGAYAHQEIPFDKLVEELQPERSLSRSPLFQVIFAFNTASVEAASMPGLELSPIFGERTASKFDIVLALTETRAAVKGTLEYNTDLFDAATVRRMIAHYLHLLDRIVADPDQRLSDLHVLTPSERHQLVYEWNRTEAEYPSHLCIHQLFEAQVERTPGAVAAACGTQQLTYSELNARAGRLARRLRSLGVGRGHLVGVCLENSLDVPVGLLGVLKAGAAYVPIEPDHPRARIAFILEDSRVSVLLTQTSLLEKTAADDLRVICLDTDWEGEAPDGGGAEGDAATPDDVAYLIYTSGSTGQPKGVKIQHRSLVNYIGWSAKVYLQGERLDFPLYSSLAFDLTVTSIYTPLITGGRVVVYRKDGAEFPLLEILQDNQVGVLKLTPSHLKLIKDMDNSRSRIKRLIVGGETLETELARQVRRSFGGRVEIYNEYGPTEATVGCMIHLFDPAADDRDSVPIGRPADNVQIYVLDESLSPTAENVIGELYISGDGVAAEYLNRPELTEQKFIDDPFRPGRKMYRSGDLARHLRGGKMELIGRRDEQVKFNGYRVELNEIRSELNKHPRVRDSVLVLRKDEGGNQVMVAYYVSRQELEAAELRQFLSQRVIEETLPNIYVHLKKLPLTLNGKVNTDALPSLEEARTSIRKGFVAPRTLVEERLAETWAGVLGVERVGVHDNFFMLGGHSLLATQVMSRVREEFQVEMPLRRIFEAPTVEELAAAVEAHLSAGHVLKAPPITPTPRDGVLPLSFPQQRLWFLDQLQPGHTAYNLSSALRLDGRLDLAALESCLSEIVKRHEILRTTFEEVVGSPVQVVHPAEPLRLPPVDLCGLPPEQREAEARRLAAEEAGRPFDLTRGPLIRVKLLRLGEEEHVLLLTMHHIISDGWSMGVLVREVSALYEAFLDGRPSPLAELPVQYADFARWQREWLQGEVLNAQMDYWRQQLSDLPVLELPTDYPRPPVQTYNGAHISFEFSPQLTQQLVALSQREGVTLYVTLLAVFNVLLSRYSGQDDIPVGTLIANRTRRETEPLIGFFVNALVMRTDLSSDPTLAQLLGRVREASLGAYAHQDIPFEMLVDRLQPARDMSRPPLFQVMFALQNTPHEALRLPGLRLSALGGESGTAKFDLTVSLAEGEGGLRGSVEYNTDLFSREAVRRLLGHYERLLGAAAGGGAAQKVSRLRMLSDDERTQLAVEWDSTAREIPDLCIHQLFEQQVERTPDAVAVVYGDEQVSYYELNERANRLASYLVAQGYGAGSIIGICLEQSTEMVVATFATLKAGCAYLPLDPNYPAERLRLMLAESRPAAVLASAASAPRLEPQATRLLRLDTLSADLAAYSAENPRGLSSPLHLAYLIFTSGSTGTPKAAAVTHRAFVNLLCWFIAEFSISAADRLLLASSFSFDLTQKNLHAPLAVGAQLHLPRAEQFDATVLTRLIPERGITLLNCTPSAAYALADGLEEEGLRGLRQVRALWLGGEPISLGRLRNWVCGEGASGEITEVVNTYGPTECTDVVSFHRVGREEAAEGEGVAIGRAVWNARLLVADACGELVPAGVAGELYVGGVCVGVGYVNDARLTAERFVPDPYSGEVGARLYRTGDLARIGRGGEVEYLGRMDQQVKVRGFRIELGEVEAALRGQAGVREAVAAVRRESGDGRLVAYLVPEEGTSELSISEVRQRLRERLPDYMIPTAYVKLESLPLTPNGKVDRRRLPAPSTDRPELEAKYVAPRSALEKEVARAWQEVLRLDKVGVNDNFFDLGGHSLSMVQVHSKLREVGPRPLSIVELFQHPTIDSLVKYLGQQQGGPEDFRRSRDRADLRREMLKRRRQQVVE